MSGCLHTSDNLVNSSEYVINLHSSIEASDCRVDEASDYGVQDKGKYLKSREKRKQILFAWGTSSQLACFQCEVASIFDEWNTNPE